MSHVSSLEHVQVVKQNNLLMIPMSSDREAEVLQEYLRKQGIGTTLHLEPVTNQCRLEVWPENDQHKVEAALESWDGHH